MPDAVPRHRPDHGGELKRGGGDISLTDRNRKGFAREPGLFPDPPLPLRARDQPSLFGSQSNPGRLSQAEQIGIFRNDINPEAVSHLIKINVARFDQSAMEIDRAVASFLPISEVAIPEV